MSEATIYVGGASIYFPEFDNENEVWESYPKY